MKLLLDDSETWRNIEWNEIAVSHRDVYINPTKANSESESREGERSVEIWISILPNHWTEIQPNGFESDRMPSILSYLYFMVYTITTTGYGDIVPVSSFAKCITSVANLFEIFFVVIFFNALLSIKSNPGPRIVKQTPIKKDPNEGLMKAGESSLVQLEDFDDPLDLHSKTGK